MIKVKDGYGKLIGSNYNGNIAHVLLSNGGNLQYAVGSTASTLVLRNASGQIESSVASTVAPFVISSTKVNTNLNADLLDGFLATGLFQSLTSAADKNLYIKIGDTEKEVSLLHASYLGGVTKEGLFTELTNVNDTTNPNSIKVTIGGTTKYLKVAYSDLAGKVVCSSSTNDVDRPIVVTNKSNGVYYSTKVTLNYSTGNVTAPTFTGTLIGNADTASKLQNKVKIWGLDFDGSSDITATLDAYVNVIRDGNANYNFASDGSGNLIIGTTAVAHTISLSTAGISKGFHMLNNGNIGIGTTTPAHKLDVNGTISSPLFYYNQVSASDAPIIYLGNNNVNSTLFRVFYSGDGSETSYVGRYGFSLKYMGANAGNANYLNLYSDAQTATSLHLVMSVDLIGAIGIGTGSTNHRLTINGNVAFSPNSNSGVIGTMYDTNDPNLYNKIKINRATNGILYYSGSWTGGDHIAHSFITAQDVTRMVIMNTTGNVGIGTTSPSAKLHVAGLVNITANSGTLTIGCLNTSYTHYSTTGGTHWFNKAVEVNGNLTPHANNSFTLGTSSTRWSNIYTYRGHIRTALSTALPTYANSPLQFDSSYNDNDASNSRYRPWFSGQDLVTSHGYGVTISTGIYRDPGYSSGGYYIGCGWDGNASSCLWKFSRNGILYGAGGFAKSGSSDSYVLLGGGGHKALSDFAMAAAYVKKAGDTMTGRLTMTGEGIIVTTATTSNYRAGVEFYKGIAADTTYSYDAQIGWHNTGGDGTGSICILPYATSTLPWGGSVGLFITKTDLKYNGVSVWHARNDGSGSGLDADLLDGTHKTGLLTALSSSSSTNLSITVGGTTKSITNTYATNITLISCYNGTTNNDLWSTIKTGNSTYLGTANIYEVYNDGGPTTYGEVLDIVSTHTNHWLSLLWFGSGKTGHLYYRNKNYNDATWGSWRTILDTGNYSSYLGYIGTTAVLASSAVQTLTGINRISNSTSAALYLGNSGNLSWVMTQNICSHSGSGNWAINIAGTAWFKNVNIGYTYSATSGYNLGVTGTGYISSTLTMGGVINTASTPGTWVSGMSGAAILYRGLSAIDDSSFWRFFNMKSSGGHVVCYGGLGNDIGFYGYYSGRTANGTDWRFTVATASGNWTATASIYAAHFYENSDLQLKTNIQEILNSDKMPIIKEFDWKEDGSHSYGLIAQELEEQGYSELVSVKDDGYKTVNYSAALSLIVGKLQVKIKELEKEIEILKNKN